MPWSVYFIGSWSMQAKFIISIFVTLLLFTSAQADSAFKWTDDEGRVFFGSKPPSGVKNIRPVVAKNFSRYSASKALVRAAESRARLGVIKEKDIAITPSEKLGPEKVSPEKVEQEAKIKPDSISTELSFEPASVTVGAQNEITACLVTVKNKTQFDVEGIQVSFEFPDGTLVPAEGPVRLNNSQGAVFSVNPENLPIKLAEGTPNTAKVLINSDADPKVGPVDNFTTTKQN